MGIRAKILSIFGNKKSTIRETAKATGLPKSTAYHLEQQSKKRSEASGFGIWETEQGQHALVRLVVSSIYIFGVKGGKGAGALHEFFKMSALDQHAGLSQNCIL